MCCLTRRKYLLSAATVVAAGGAVWYFVFAGMAVPEARELRSFVRAKPPVPVVFTSRTESGSFEAAAPEAEGFKYPGTIPWPAREGRLRLLDTAGKVYELTWGQLLPDGSTLIDVMSPSVSLDGKRVLFAGRKASPDTGRWRIYQVNVDGSDLKQLTGGPNDAGCVALPPLRFAADGSRMPDEDRRRLDYDDTDPTDLGPMGFAFASSRLPDLGRDHARRATQIWRWSPGASAPSPLSANRNNDRWPILVPGDMLLFSLWSRNREAVTADYSDVRPVASGGQFATDPSDQWSAMWVMPNAAQIGFAVKCPEAVWRPRPLGNGRVAFMTGNRDRTGPMRLAQADWGYLRSAPSSLAVGATIPNLFGGERFFGPERDAEGRELSAGCPSPCPGGEVLFAGAPIGSDAGAFGLYSCPEDWKTPQTPRLLFDDPALVDAEPVAVYARAVECVLREEPVTTETRPKTILLANGQEHLGPAGYLENLAVHDAIRSPIPRRYAETDRPGDPRFNPIIPPAKSVKSIAFYAAHRDRFDDPTSPRVIGNWEKLMVSPVADGGLLRTWVPADPLTPTALVGLDAEGKIAWWNGTAKDAAGRAATYFAYAGDHYSGTRVNGYHYCNGCHTGHTHMTADIRERTK